MKKVNIGNSCVKISLRTQKGNPTAGQIDTNFLEIEICQKSEIGNTIKVILDVNHLKEIKDLAKVIAEIVE